MPFMTNWIMVNVAHGSPTMNSSTPWPYNASRKAAPGWGLPQIIQVMDDHFSTETMLKPMVTWGSAIFQDNIYIYIHIDHYISNKNHRFHVTPTWSNPTGRIDRQHVACTQHTNEIPISQKRVIRTTCR